MTISVGVAARDAELDAAIVLDGGSLRIYAGTPPANADAALSGNTLIAEFPLLTPAFGAASSGTKTMNLPASVFAVGAGTPTFFRCYKADGTTCAVQGTVGASGDLVMSGSAIIGDEFSLTALSLSAV